MVDLYTEQVKDISVDDLKNRMGKRERGYLIVDAREISDYYRGHIPGACSLFDGELNSLAQSLDKNADIVVYGPGQPRGESQNPMDRLSGDAIDRFRKLGFKNVMELKGGITSWTMANNRLDKSEPGSLKPAQVPFTSSAESGTRDTSGGTGGA